MEKKLDIKMILFRKHDERKIHKDYNEIRKISIERDYECLDNPENTR